MSFLWPPVDMPSGRAGRRRRRGRDEDPRTAGLLRLASSGAVVAPAISVQSPLVSELVGADLAFQFTVLAWRSRRPAWWRVRAFLRWRGERAGLEAMAARLRERSDELAVGGPRPCLPPPTTAGGARERDDRDNRGDRGGRRDDRSGDRSGDERRGRDREPRHDQRREP